LIRIVVFDIDGVLTDGRSWIDDRGGEAKTLRFRDLDALWTMHQRGYLLAFVTGEATAVVSAFKDRLPPVFFVAGCKDKLGAVTEFARREGAMPAEVCYVGDGESDVLALSWVGLGICPADASASARVAAAHVLQAVGGAGVAEEVLLKLDACGGHWRLLSPLRSERPAKIIALVPARGGSKRLPRKNLRTLAGKPLVVHSIEHGLASRYIERVIVSTDDREIAAIANAAGAEVPFIRPAEFATDSATDLDVFRHCLLWLLANEGCAPDLVVQLRPTAPVRRAAEVDRAIEQMLADPSADSLRSVSISPLTPYKMWHVAGDWSLRPVASVASLSDPYDQPRQWLPPVYVQDGFVDIVRPRTVLEFGSMAGRRILAFTHADHVVDVDDEDGLRRAEAVMSAIADATISRVPYDDGSGAAGIARLGIMIGRLTAAPPGVLQWFPQPGWRLEFASAAVAGFEHIEFFVERTHNPDNPLWSEEGVTALRKLMEQSGVNIECVCADLTITVPLPTEATESAVVRVIERASAIGASRVVLPLFDANSLLSCDWRPMVAPLRRLVDVAARLHVSLCVESELAASDLLCFLGLVGHDGLRVCYDIGNSTALGHEVNADIRRLDGLIAHVHIKDKTMKGENVALGKGAANLEGALRSLFEGSFTGPMTLETPRGDDPARSAALNRQLIEDICVRIRAKARK
jgi:N-acylneuraminate cytidylyltransferase